MFVDLEGLPNFDGDIKVVGLRIRSKGIGIVHDEDDDFGHGLIIFIGLSKPEKFNLNERNIINSL